MRFYVWDESYTDEGVGGAEVEAETADDAIAQFHGVITGGAPLEDEDYHAVTEKPDWWDNEEPGAEVKP